MVHRTRSPGLEEPVEQSTADEFYLDLGLDLAWLGAGRTRSNPMVGAVVVRDGRIIGQGYHAAYGLDHAETVALDRAGELARGATLYVTLEPCTHHGKTPPCIDRILASGVARVVVCTLDPDPRMDGQGIRALEAHGIEVDVGYREERALLLNLPYFKRTLNHSCAVTLKMSMTMDGRIAAGPEERTRISGSEAQRYVHRLRASRDAVLIGINTLLVDEPRLDCRRLEDVEVPVPVVMDTHLRFPEHYRWVEESRELMIICGNEVDDAKARAIESCGGAVIRCPSKKGRVPVGDAIEGLVAQGVSSVLVEGGSEIFSSFLNEGTWDDLRLLVSPAVCGPAGVSLVDQSVAAGTIDAVTVEAKNLAGDVLLSYLNSETCRAVLERIL